MATANSCSGTKKTEDMSTEKVCNWIKTNFDDTKAAKFAGRATPLITKMAWKVELCQKYVLFISELFSFKQSKKLMERALFC